MRTETIINYVGDGKPYQVPVRNKKEMLWNFRHGKCFHKDRYYEGVLKSCLRNEKAKLRWLRMMVNELDRRLRLDQKALEYSLLEFAETLIWSDCFWQSPPMSLTGESQRLKDDVSLERQAELSKWRSLISDTRRKYYRRSGYREGRYV